ncbi:MAG: GNAT family N-acetyltransferase [Gammaproteobacteria bacterium]|nr:GNAT family N-acetyltransferase [Gammaproteobacteria bacterium]
MEDHPTYRLDTRPAARRPRAAGDDLERPVYYLDPSRPLQIRGCSAADFRQIHQHLGDYWGGLTTRQLARVAALHHPMLLHQFGDTAYSMRDGDVVAAYLFGFLSQTDGRQAYIHLAGVHRAYRRRGLAARLYRHFFAVCALSGRTRVTAVTSAGNERSLAFHRAMGMEINGPVPDYRGDGVDMYVMSKEIPGKAP